MRWLITLLDMLISYTGAGGRGGWYGTGEKRLNPAFWPVLLFVVIVTIAIVAYLLASGPP